MGQISGKETKKRILDLFFPPRCAVCDGLLSPGETGICSSCKGKLPLVEEPRCFCCGKTVENPEIEYCRDCSRKRHIFLQGFPLCRYIPPVSDAMALLKYHGRAEYADFYGRMLVDTFGEKWKSLGIRTLAPVPVHGKRLRERGYNQAELLAKAISEVTGIPVDTGLIIRSSSTVAQKKLTREERSLNLRNAFQPGKNRPPDTVLVVDDIFTTGATADACAAVLLKNGAKRVYVTTVCC